MIPFSLYKLRWLLLVLGCLICIGVLSLLLRPTPDLKNWVPASTAFLIETTGFNLLNAPLQDQNNPFVHAFFATSLAKQFQQDAAQFQKMIRVDTALNDHIGRAKTLCAYSLQPSEAQHALFALQLDASYPLTRVLAQTGVRTFPTQFKGYTLYTLYTGKKEQLVLVRVKNYLIFSRFSYLVEDALTQYERSSHWWSGRKYEAVLPADAPWKFYLRPEQCTQVIRTQLQTQWAQLPQQLAQQINWLGIAWDGTQLYAVAEAQGALKQMGTWGKSNSGKMLTIIPDHVALWAQAGFERRAQFWDPFTHGADPAFRKYILPWVGSELAFVLTAPLSPGMLEDQFLVVATRDQQKVAASLKAYGAERGTLKVDTYQMFEVYTFLDQAILEPILGVSSAFRNPVCTVVGDYVVFAGSRSAMEVWLDKYIVNQTLANHTDFLQLYAAQPQRGNGMLYFNTGYLKLLLQQLLQNPLEASGDWQQWEKAGLIGVQTQVLGRDRLDVKINVQASPNSQAETGILWKTPLAAPARTQPFVCDATGNDPKVLIQDVAHTLYCLGMNGATQWRRQLTAPILSAVYALDFFDNGRSCYLFNTTEAIWLLDEQGKTVDGFPIRLQSPASNGLCLVDFDGNHRFSLFLACKNGNIYGYDQYGRPLAGWNPLPAKGKVIHPMLHFQEANQDYLVALNAAGKLWVFGRNGAAHFPAITLPGLHQSPPQLSAVQSGNKQIACFNTTGQITLVDVRGGVKQLRAGTTQSATTGISSMDSKLFTLLEGKQLYIGNGAAPFKMHHLSAPLDTLFAIGGHTLGGLQRSTATIYLLDKQGKTGVQFPLAGTTAFTVYQKSGNGLLLTGNGASVYAYKLGAQAF